MTSTQHSAQDMLRDAAAELMRLKKLKEWIAANKHNGKVPTVDYQAACEDYARNKPLAWESLERALDMQTVESSQDEPEDQNAVDEDDVRSVPALAGWLDHAASFERSETIAHMLREGARWLRLLMSAGERTTPEFERELPTARRIAAVDLLLSQGYNWRDGEWHRPTSSLNRSASWTLQDILVWLEGIDNIRVPADLWERAIDAIAGTEEFTVAQCEAVFEAVSMANITRDVKSPERKRRIILNALGRTTAPTGPAPSALQLLRSVIDDERKTWTGDHRKAAGVAMDSVFERFQSVAIKHSIVLVPPLGPIDRDEEYERDYIPLPGGWEIQTKGKGSTFRLAEPDGSRIAIPDQPYIHETLERMARDIHTACSSRDPEQ